MPADTPSNIGPRAQEYPAMTRHVGFTRLVISALFVTTVAVAAVADSHVRIVRLSSVEGDVQIARSADESLDRAILNTPIIEGTRLVTGSNGLAEVEFENQSALRLTDDSEVKFTQLLMNDAGTKINRIDLVKGLVYFDTASKGDDDYLVNVGDKTFVIGRNSLTRISMTPDRLQVAVFKGEVELEGQVQPVVVKKKETLTLDLKNTADVTVAKGVEDQNFDNWNKEREDYSKTYASNEGYGGPSHAFGLQDLNYYGDYFYAPGYGYVWQPYGFAGSMVGWNPYMNGAWTFCPGFGYMWASAYPWGWLPFHYGSWAFINGAGWAWVPGRYPGRWYTNGYRNVPVIRSAPAGFTAPAPPVTTGGVRHAPTVIVGKAGTQPLAIPGGRIPPNFASLAPGHPVTPAATHGFVTPSVNTAAGNHPVFAAPRPTMTSTHAGPNGHVFAAPSSRAVFSDPGAMHSSLGGSRAMGVPTGGGMRGGLSGGAVHGGSAGASHGGGGGSHK